MLRSRVIKYFFFGVIGLLPAACERPLKNTTERPSKNPVNGGLEQIVYLPPSSFSELPHALKSRLESMGCRVPQPYIYKNRKTYNVIKGKFAGTGEEDWAILCSRNNKSVILVFPDDNVDNMLHIEIGEDRNGMQSIGDKRTGYSILIETIPEKKLNKMNLKYAGNPRKHSRDGIAVFFLDKASMLHYYHNKKWLSTQLSD